MGECHCLSEYISFMCVHTELTEMLFLFFVIKTVLMQTWAEMTVLLCFVWYLNAFKKIPVYF